MLVDDFESKQIRTNLTCASINDSCHYLPSSPIEQGFSLPCKCGLSDSGKAYCPSLYRKGYTQRLAEVIEIFGMHCHTMERHSIYKCFLKGAKTIQYLVDIGDDEETKLT